ncbi:toll-like receptor 21 [Hoplias malabaricus]|uniref:toll-like receptor 21 n=1 Tax=Hoplias malabaricus TaxID=27720 RepID=UPI0034625301
MALQMYPKLISVAIFTSFLQLSSTYSFKNCVEKANSNHTIFICKKGSAHRVEDIVGDLLPSATNLTISNWKVTEITSESFRKLPTLKILVLSNNNLMDIHEDAFDNLGYLQTLNLSSNYLKYLSPSLFRGLHNLTKLFLADNRLTNLSLNLFSDLTNLKILDLHKNQLADFSAVGLSIANIATLMELKISSNKITSLNHSASLPQSLVTLHLQNNELNSLGNSSEFLSNVKVLDLSYNKLLSTRAFKGLNLSSIISLYLRSTNVSVIKLLDRRFINVSPRHINFSGLNLNMTDVISLCKTLLNYPVKYLKNMTLESNSIKTLTRKTFSHCPKITSLLDLSHNNLNTPRCLEFLAKQEEVKMLKVEHNHLTKLLTCKYMTFPNLRHLSYRYNRILLVNAFAFHHVPKLQTLQLNINIIAYLDHKALSGLRDLTVLRLDNNLLSDLYSDTFEDLCSLRRLLLRNNQIAVIFNNTFHALKNLAILDLGGNKITHLEPEALNGLDSLEKLYLDRNRFKEIDSLQLGRLCGTLQVLDLEKNFIYYYTEDTYSPFVNLTKLNDLKLDGQLPSGINILPSAFFHGLTSLKSLYLSDNHISYFGAHSFDDLKNLTYLTLDNSCVGVTKLVPGIFKNLHKLETLFVENMGLESFSKEVFRNLTALKVLHLNRNAMQTLNVDLLENLTNLQYIDARNSPLSCNCLNKDLQNYTKNNQRIQFVYLYNMTCSDLRGSSFYNFETNVCYVEIELYLFSTTFSVTILLTLLPLMYVKLYWKFKYGYYVFRSWFGEQWRRLREQEEKYIYDAFISYNSADEKWVMGELLPNLEGNGSFFRLCLHHRDFEPGRNIVDNIVAAVYNSRKTVCLVSQNFLRSEWCSLEIQLASYRLFQEMQDVLLLVFLESIPERQLSVYHRMRKVMLKKTYLQWPGTNCTDPTKAQELFWKQLKKALRSSNATVQEEEQRGAHVPIREQRDELGVEERDHFVNEPQTDDEECYLMP